MTIPSELLSASDLQGSAKKLVSYLRSFFEEKYSHQNIGRVTVKLEPVPINLQSKVEHELQKFELNDPQMPHQISIGVVYCKEGQKEEEEYFQNGMYSNFLDSYHLRPRRHEQGIFRLFEDYWKRIRVKRI